MEALLALLEILRLFFNELIPDILKFEARPVFGRRDSLVGLLPSCVEFLAKFIQLEMVE